MVMGQDHRQRLAAEMMHRANRPFVIHRVTARDIQQPHLLIDVAMNESRSLDDGGPIPSKSLRL